MDFTKSQIWNIAKTYDNYGAVLKWTSKKEDMVNFINYQDLQEAMKEEYDFLNQFKQPNLNYKPVTQEERT